MVRRGSVASRDLSHISVRGDNPYREIETNPVFQRETGLKGDFKRRFGNDAKRFYRVGRVFMMFMHQELSSYKEKGEASSTKGLATRNKNLGIDIISHKTRFVVVREGPAYCWAIPVHTYGGRGLLKPGLKPEDIRAHAMIFTGESTPPVIKHEPPMTKRAIRVKPANDTRDCLLDPASRVNFAKPTTIEHNVNAVNVGSVHENSMPYLIQYWEEQASGRFPQIDEARHK